MQQQAAVNRDDQIAVSSPEHVRVEDKPVPVKVDHRPPERPAALPEIARLAEQEAATQRASNEAATVRAASDHVSQLYEIVDENDFKRSIDEILRLREGTAHAAGKPFDKQEEAERFYEDIDRKFRSLNEHDQREHINERSQKYWRYDRDDTSGVDAAYKDAAQGILAEERGRKSELVTADKPQEPEVRAAREASGTAAGRQEESKRDEGFHPDSSTERPVVTSKPFGLAATMPSVAETYAQSQPQASSFSAASSAEAHRSPSAASGGWLEAIGNFFKAVLAMIGLGARPAANSPASIAGAGSDVRRAAGTPARDPAALQAALDRGYSTGPASMEMEPLAVNSGLPISQQAGRIKA